MRQANGFVDRLAKTAEQLLLQADGLLTVDDIERGRKYTSHLTRGTLFNIYKLLYEKSYVMI